MKPQEFSCRLLWEGGRDRGMVRNEALRRLRREVSTPLPLPPPFLPRHGTRRILEGFRKMNSPFGVQLRRDE